MCLDSCNNDVLMSDVRMGMMLMIHHIVHAVCAVDCSSKNTLSNSYSSVAVWLFTNGTAYVKVDIFGGSPTPYGPEEPPMMIATY